MLSVRCFPWHGESIANFVLVRGHLHQQPRAVHLPHAVLFAAKGASILIKPLAAHWAATGHHLRFHGGILHARKTPTTNG